MLRVLHQPSSVFTVFAVIFLSSLAAALISAQYWLVSIPFVLLSGYAALLYPLTLFYLLLFSIPFSFEYHFPGGAGTDLPDEPLMWLLCLVFLPVCLPKSRMYFIKLSAHPLVLLTVCMITWTAFTVIYSADLVVSIKFLLAKSWYVLVFVFAALYFLQAEKQLVMLARILVLSMSLVVLIILSRQAQSGFEFAFVNDAARPFFRNHVTYGALLVCTIPVLYALFAGAAGYSHPRTASNWRPLLLIVLGLFLVALFFTYSRGAWIALLVGLSAHWFLKRKLLVTAFIISLAISVFAVMWLKSGDRYLDYAPDYKTTIFHKDFSRHLISTYKLKDLSTEERFYRWIAAIRMVKEYWLTGAGPGTFYPVYKEFTIPAFKTYVSDNPEHSTVHNYFLLILVEQGIPGLLLFILLAGAVFYYAQQNYHRAGNRRGRLIASTTGTVFAMILTLNFLSDLVETDKTGSLFFLCVAVVTIQNQRLTARLPTKLYSPPHIQCIP